MLHPSQQRPSPARRKARPCIALTIGDKVLSFQARPLAAAVAVAGFVLLSTAYIAATAYLVYRDDLLGGALVRQVDMQYAYEDRIAALRAELDRVTSRHIVARQGIGEQVATLLERQALLQRRQQDLTVVTEAARGAGIDVAGALARMPRSRPDVAHGRRVSGAVLAYAPSAESRAEIITGSLIRESGAQGATQPHVDLKPTLQNVGAELDGAQQDQLLTLDALSAATDARADALSSALEPLGVTRGAIEEPVRPDTPQGGPFIPAGGLHFVEKLSLLSRNVDAVAALRRQADALPLRMPCRATGFSSRFGTRDDPFLHRPAFHAGLDFVAPTGTEVRATGAGTVVSAGWSGGYGQMVEIRHANGVTTRYGHLSAVLVRAGDPVVPGAPIGRVGSTGRSTGPHLHYETRRDGEPVDPALFLAAGRALKPA